MFTRKRTVKIIWAVIVVLTALSMIAFLLVPLIQF